MAHTLVIKTTIVSHKVTKDVTLVLRRTFDFVPREGMKFRFSNDNKDVMEVELVNLCFDNNERVFLEEQQDETLTEDLRNPERVETVVTNARMQEYVDYYKSFGWEPA